MNIRAAGILFVIPIAEAHKSAPDDSRCMVQHYVSIARIERAASSVRSLTGSNGSSYDAALAGMEQGPDDLYKSGQGVQGYTRRFGKLIAARAFETGFASVLGEQFAPRAIGAAIR